MLYLFTSLY